jgi:hypothetical protein
MRSSAEAAHIPVPSHENGDTSPESWEYIPLQREIPHGTHIEVEKEASEVPARRIKLNIIRKGGRKEISPADNAEEPGEEAPRSRKLKLTKEKPAETTPEKELAPLDLTRKNFVDMDRRTAKVFQKLAKEKDPEKIRQFEEAMSRHKFTAADRPWLGGEGPLAEDAMKRRDDCLNELKTFGLSDEEALTAYAREISRLEYEAEKSDRKHELAADMEEPVLVDYEEKFEKPRTAWSPDEVLEASKAAQKESRLSILEFVLQEGQALNEARTEKSAWVETIKKGTDWWAAKPRSVRLATSTAIFTVLHAATGGTDGLALFAGKRLARSLIAASAGQVVAGAVGKGMSKYYGIQERREALEKAKEEFNPEDEDFEKRFFELEEDLKKDTRKIIWTKMAVMIGAGYLSSYSLPKLYELAEQEATAFTPGIKEVVAHTKEAVGVFEEVEAPAPPSPHPLPSPAAIQTPGIEEAERVLVGMEEAARKTEEMATVHKGEGIWHAVERQITEHLKTEPVKYGLSPEDISDPQKFQNAVDRETGRLLEKENLLSRNGAEIGAKAFVDLENKTVRIEGKTWEPAPEVKVSTETPEERLSKLGFDEESLEVVKQMQVGGILEQTDRAIASYPPSFRGLAEELRGSGAPHGLTVEEWLQKYPETRLPHMHAEIESHSTPEPVKENVIEAPVKPGFAETLITKQSLGPALQRQLSAHLGLQYNALPEGTQSEIAGFLKETVSGDKNILKVNMDRLTPGDRVNFGPLFENKELLKEAFEFPKEAALLDELHFSSDEIFDGSYIQVIRNMPVHEYFEAFEKGTRNGFYAEYGLRKLLEHNGVLTSFYVDEGHIELARLIERSGLTSENRDLSVAQFLKKVSEHSISA